jgi:hypothetical protein
MPDGTAVQGSGNDMNVRTLLLEQQRLSAHAVVLPGRAAIQEPCE